MKFWIHNHEALSSVVLANETSFLVGQCQSADVGRVGKALASLEKPVEVLGAENVEVIPYIAVDKVVLCESDCTVEVSYTKNQESFNVTTNFNDADYAREFVDYITAFLPNDLAQKHDQQSLFSATALPLFIAVLTAISSFLLWDKYRLGVQILIPFAGLACAALLYRQLKNRPELISWSTKGKQQDKQWINYTPFKLGLVVFTALVLVSVISPKRYGESTLHNLVATGKATQAGVQSALERGADIQYADDNGITTLQLALDNQSHDAAVAIVVAGANVQLSMTHRPSGRALSSLEYAIKAGTTDEVLKVLLERGALLAAENSGFHAAEYAIENQNDTLLALIHAQFN